MVEKSEESNGKKVGAPRHGEAKNAPKKRSKKIKKRRAILRKFLYDFFALFLAITLGFFVENERENYVDRQKEKQFVKSLIDDIKMDTLDIAVIIHSIEEQLLGMDSLLVTLEEPITDTYIYNIYRYSLSYFGSSHYFQGIDRTMAQLKNAGWLRIIRSKKVSDCIAMYNMEVEGMQKIGDYCLKLFYDLSLVQKKVLNLKFIRLGNLHELKQEDKLTLLTNDSHVLELFYNDTFYYKGIMESYKNSLVELNNLAVHLLNLLQSEYGL